MPLIKGFGKKAFGKNIGAEVKAGKPKKQALAIAFSVGRKAAKKAGKGKKPPSFLAKVKGMKKPKKG